MFIAFIALEDDEYTERCPRGNGKTCALVYYLYRYYKIGYKVWTNFKTTFSDKIMGFQAMITELKRMKEAGESIGKIVLGISEMQELINSIGSSLEQTLFVDSFANQMRKLNVNCFYDTQILKHIHKRLRRHTENIRIPVKLHLDGLECNFDNCTKKHLIDIYSLKPFKKFPIKTIKAWVVGQMYDTSEIIEDELIIPKREKVKIMNKGENNGVKS
jgi:hypothetical protein